MYQRYDAYDVCASIREQSRMDAGRKGKQCPGGYWIPANKQCGKGGKGGKMRSPGGGNLGRNLAIGGLATVGAGALAYKGRNKIVEGVDKAGKAVREGTRAAVGKANEMIGGYQAKSQQEEMNKQELMRRVSAAGRGIERATGMASRTARSARSAAEGAVGGAKEVARKTTRRAERIAKVAAGRASQGVSKAQETFAGVAGGGKKKEEGK